MLHETTPPQRLPNSFPFIGNLSAQNVILFNKISQSGLQLLDFFVLLNDCLYNIGSVHAFSDQSALSLIGILVSFGDFFESGFESDVLLFFGRGEFASNGNELLLNALESLSEFFVFSLLTFEL